MPEILEINKEYIGACLSGVKNPISKSVAWPINSDVIMYYMPLIEKNQRCESK